MAFERRILCGTLNKSMIHPTDVRSFYKLLFQCASVRQRQSSFAPFMCLMALVVMCNCKIFSLEGEVGDEGVVGVCRPNVGESL